MSSIRQQSCRLLQCWSQSTTCVLWFNHMRKCSGQVVLPYSIRPNCSWCGFSSNLFHALQTHLLPSHGTHSVRPVLTTQRLDLDFIFLCPKDAADVVRCFQLIELPNLQPNRYGTLWAVKTRILLIHKVSHRESRKDLHCLEQFSQDRERSMTGEILLCSITKIISSGEIIKEKFATRSLLKLKGHKMQLYVLWSIQQFQSSPTALFSFTRTIPGTLHLQCQGIDFICILRASVHLWSSIKVVKGPILQVQWKNINSASQNMVTRSHPMNSYHGLLLFYLLSARWFTVLHLQNFRDFPSRGLHFEIAFILYVLLRQYTLLLSVFQRCWKNDLYIGLEM